MAAVAVFLFLLASQVLAHGDSCETTFTQFPGSNYSACAVLPVNSAKLSWSWDNSTRIMSAVFTHHPEGSGGWVAWGINHNDTRTMIYSSVLACFPDSTGTPVVKQYFLSEKEDDGVNLGGQLTVVSNSCVIDAATSPPTYYLKFELNLGRKPKIYQVYGGGPGVDTSTLQLKQHSPASNVGVFIDIRNTTFVNTGVSEFYTDEKNVLSLLILTS